MDTDRRPSWLVTAVAALAVCVLAAIVFRFGPKAQDDGTRPAYFGHCGGTDYVWHYDPRTVPSGASCVVERVER